MIILTFEQNSFNFAATPYELSAATRRRGTAMAGSKAKPCVTDTVPQALSYVNIYL
ncbi:MAG: hypothetical protein IJU39_03475 [Clostridia bacterium]|nr:hypothetical protein [Clostridia bacterium]